MEQKFEEKIGRYKKRVQGNLEECLSMLKNLNEESYENLYDRIAKIQGLTEEARGLLDFMRVAIRDQEVYSTVNK